MTIKIANLEFDHFQYDDRGDVLYLSVGHPMPAAYSEASPEGHEIRYADDGSVIGLTIVNAKWLMDTEGSIAVTPPPLRVDAEAIAPALELAEA